MMETPEVDRRKQELTTGEPVPADRSHTEIDTRTGMQRGYIVLSPEERAKGFVRPVRRTYKHVGVRPKYPVRDLTPEEQTRYADCNYVAFEAYPPSETSSVTGRFWTQKQLQSGCRTDTHMGLSLAETYARDPHFYSGTFCCYCRTHFPLEEFVWEGTNEVLGS